MRRERDVDVLVVGSGAAGCGGTALRRKRQLLRQLRDFRPGGRCVGGAPLPWVHCDGHHRQRAQSSRGLADEAPPPDVPRTTAGVAASLTAAEVAEQVVEAITSNRFWILTHDRYRTVIIQHASDIGTAARPAPAPIW
jgi:hypothetical protein